MKTIGQLYKEWQSLQPLTEENQARLDRKFNLEFNYNSNHLEGNTLTYSQTELLFMFGETSGDAKLRDYEEMNAHNVALRMVREEAKEDKPLTEKFIRDLNELILVKPFYKNAETTAGSTTRMKVHIGGYKTRPNHVKTATGEVFYYATPEETPAMMSALVSWFNEQEKAGILHPLELASLFHYRFIRIHPFEDGNGRIARLLVNYVLMRHDYPMVVIKSERKEEYLQALRRADILVGLTPSDGANAELPQIEPFLNYMKEQMEYSLRLCIKAAKGESLDEPGDLDKKLRNLKKELGASQEEVQLTYSGEIVKLMIDTVVFPLMDSWEKTLKGFGNIILGREVIIYGPYDYSGYRYERTATDFDTLKLILSDEEDVAGWRDNKFQVTLSREREIEFGVYVEGVLNICDCTLGGGTIKLKLFSQTYQISNSANDKVLTKMYHQPLSEGEINEIVEALGNKLLEDIEAKRG